MAIRRTTAMWGALLALAWAAGGCATKPEVVPSAGPRPPTQPDQVKIYQKQPLRYERLGVVSLPVTAETKWDEGGNADAAFDKLRSQAAALGANGLLLVVEGGDTKYGRVLAGYHNDFYQVPVDRTGPQRRALAEAIYVLKEY